MNKQRLGLIFQICGLLIFIISILNCILAATFGANMSSLLGIILLIAGCFLRRY